MEIHIGKNIKEKFTASGLSVTELARRIRTTRQNVYTIFDRSSIDTALLLRLGDALKCNFFHLFIDNYDVMEDGKASYVRRAPKVILQIEVDREKEDEIIRLAFGDSAADLINED